MGFPHLQAFRVLNPDPLTLTAHSADLPIDHLPYDARKLGPKLVITGVVLKSRCLFWCFWGGCVWGSGGRAASQSSGWIVGKPSVTRLNGQRRVRGA